jgi:lipopolysaccharide biosynthesis glycosyltransferase
MNTINVATALNKRYIKYTVVMLTSLCENSNDHVNVYLLNSELDHSDINEISKALSAYDITVNSVKIDAGVFTDRFPRNLEWSLEMYYRLMMPELLPPDVDRVLYLDVDIIVNKPLSDFFKMDFGGMELLVCDDKGGKNLPSSYGKKHAEMFKEAYQNGHRYFNSGVMLMNIKLLKERYTFDTYLDAIRAWNYEMEAPDQDVLNWVHWRNVSYVDYKDYDYFAKVAHNDGITYNDAKHSISIIHYAGDKPWNFDHLHYDIERIWWEYAQLTPYYDEFLDHYIEDATSGTSVEKSLTNLYKTNIELKEILQKLMNLASKLVDKSKG